jgi:hypothetical protein
MSRRCAAGSVRISRRDTLDENLGLVIEGQASVLLENLLDVREHLPAIACFGVRIT